MNNSSRNLGGVGMRWTAHAVRDYAYYVQYDESDPVNAVLGTLPAVDRRLFKEAYWERRPRREMGAEWGVSGCTICVHLTRILQTIAAELN